MSVGVNMELLNIVLFAALFATGFADVAKFTDCGDGSDICEVTAVRIAPCNINKKKRCVLKKLTNVSLSFDFTPNFAADKLKTKVYWDNNGLDVPFDGFGSDDGCSYTKCPTETGTSQSLTYNMYVDKTLPRGIFPLKWVTWNEHDNSQRCCFKTSIEIRNN